MVPSHSCCNLLGVPADYVYVEQIFPLFAAMGAALGICGFAIARNIAINPDVRISKEDRAAGILENYNEGKSYKDHSLRDYVKDCKPEIMPGLNRFFSASK